MSKKKFTLRDIRENHIGEPDLAYLQLRLSLAGEMKTCIKRFLDAHPEMASCSHSQAMLRAMENFCNGTV